MTGFCLKLAGKIDFDRTSSSTTLALCVMVELADVAA